MRVELTDVVLHIVFGLSCFYHKPENFWNKIFATFFWWRYWSPDVDVLVPGCIKIGPEMLSEELGTFLRKIKVHGWWQNCSFFRNFEFTCLCYYVLQIEMAVFDISWTIFTVSFNNWTQLKGRKTVQRAARHSFSFLNDSKVVQLIIYYSMCKISSFA